ncbi:MAG: hypothetical protein H0T84_14870 [Tatlockia sp.]|nr:hypothetical protein [Tatlockia sp.]
MINFKPLLYLYLVLFSLSYQPQAQAQAHSNNKLASIKMTIDKIINERGKKTIFIKLRDSNTNKAITLTDLTEVHTQKIHLLVIDDSLSDYSHIHPVASNEPGLYYFFWQPLIKNANYRIWADLVPLKTHQQEYVIADLYKAKLSSAKIIPNTALQSNVDGYLFKLSFDQPELQKGIATMGKVEVSDALGKPVYALEPLMGAYAHIVGFSDNFSNVVHIHPMGIEPKKNTDRGGPELAFHIEPQKAGFIKLFAQVKIKGKEYFAPFGVVVQDTKSKA